MQANETKRTDKFSKMPRSPWEFATVAQIKAQIAALQSFIDGGHTADRSGAERELMMLKHQWLGNAEIRERQ